MHLESPDVAKDVWTLSDPVAGHGTRSHHMKAVLRFYRQLRRLRKIGTQGRFEIDVFGFGACMPRMHPLQAHLSSAGRSLPSRDERLFADRVRARLTTRCHRQARFRF
jgi:hypothetical protein